LINLYDIVWGAGVGVTAPYWLIRPSTRRKVLSAFRDRMGNVPAREGTAPTLLIHAVSVGEMNATRALIQQLREIRPDLYVYVSSTTETGFARGQELYGHAKDMTVVRYPLDFSGAVRRLLDAARPDLVLLMELEVWPNFMKQCASRGIPVVLGNARLTTTSFRNYSFCGPLVKRMFRRLTLICAQDVTYAERFLALGVKPHHVVIAGTMKFDNPNLASPGEEAFARAELLGLQPDLEPIWVCGSTGPGEEELILRVYRKLLGRFSRLRLVIVPRHPPRFEEVADLIADFRFECVRLSTTTTPPPANTSPLPAVVLVDAMGVLRDFYAVADVVFVGRSIVDLGPRQHGSDMIEPAALGKPILVGPHTANFADAMLKFRAAEALLEVADEESLEQSLSVLLSTPGEAKAMGNRAAAVVTRERGATQRHVRVILQLLAVKRGEDQQRPPDPGSISLIGGSFIPSAGRTPQVSFRPVR
jgi:3-deoxy-D-manno-octulosonic-acid transferase